MDSVKTLLEKLNQDYLGTFEGVGLNHEGQVFNGVLEIRPQIKDKGLSIDFKATGVDGTIFHQEHSLLGLTPMQSLSLWVMSNNHPGVMEHRLTEESLTSAPTQKLHFHFGDFGQLNSFRETISLELETNGDISYTYFWGMPGGEYKERSRVKLRAGKNRPIPEAKIEMTELGKRPVGSGWFVLNAKEACWGKNAKFGEVCRFEGDRRFEQYGMNLHVVHPGQPSCHYHGEDDQEDFLVVQGECKLLIEGEERLLKQWDFVHCPKWARHVFVGAGDGSCAIVMVGGRSGNGVIYPVLELYKKYQCSPDEETTSPQVSYAKTPATEPAACEW